MNTISSKIKRFCIYIFLICFLLFTINCKESQTLKIKQVELCDNYDQEVNCIQPVPAHGIVKLKPTSNSREKESWENFSNYLYFTARETPGFVITFSRPLSELEKSHFRNNYSAYLSVDGVREKMEGFEIGENKIASFHYLGSILKDAKRQKKIQNQKPDLTKDGHFLLQFEFEAPMIDRGSIQREIQLEWQ